MLQDGLNGLPAGCTEKDILDTIDFEISLDNFVSGNLEILIMRLDVTTPRSEM
jgi:hypothetical protein